MPIDRFGTPPSPYRRVPPGSPLMAELSAAPRRDLARSDRSRGGTGLPPPDTPPPPPFPDTAVAVEVGPDHVPYGDGPVFLLVLLGLACWAVPKTFPPESWAWFTGRALLAAIMAWRCFTGLRGRWRWFRSPPRSWIVFEPERIHRLDRTASGTECLYASRADVIGVLFTRSQQAGFKGWYLFLDLRERGLVPLHIMGKDREAVVWLAEQTAAWAGVPVTWREDLEANSDLLPTAARSDPAGQPRADRLSNLEAAAITGAVGLTDGEETGDAVGAIPSRRGPAPSLARTPAEAADPETGRPDEIIRLGPDTAELRRLPRIIHPGADNASLGPESVGYRVMFPSTSFGCALIVFVPILFLSWYLMEACHRQAGSAAALLPGALLLAFGLACVLAAYLERFRRTYLVLDPDAFGCYHFRWRPKPGRFFRRGDLAAVEWVRPLACEKSGVEWVHPDGREKPGIYRNAGFLRLRTRDGTSIDLDPHHDNPRVVAWLARRLSRWADVPMTRVDDGPTLPEFFPAAPPSPDRVADSAPPATSAPPPTVSAVPRAPVDIDAAYVALADEARQFLESMEPSGPRTPDALVPASGADSRPAEGLDARRIPSRFALRAAGSPEFSRLWKHYAPAGTAFPSPEAFALEDREGKGKDEYTGVGCIGLFCLVWVSGVGFATFSMLKSTFGRWLEDGTINDLPGLLFLIPFWLAAGFLIWRAVYYLWGGAAYVFDGDRLHLFRRGAFRRHGESVIRTGAIGVGWQPPAAPGQASGPLLLRRQNGDAIDLMNYRRGTWPGNREIAKEERRVWSWLGARIAAWAGVAFTEEADPEREAVRAWSENRPPPRVTPLPAGSKALATAWRRLAPEGAAPLSAEARGWLWREIGEPGQRIIPLIMLPLMLGFFSFIAMTKHAPWVIQAALVAGWMFWGFVAVEVFLDALRRRGLFVEPERLRIVTRSVGVFRRERIVEKADILRLTGERTGWTYRLFGRRRRAETDRPQPSDGGTREPNEGLSLRAHLRDGSIVELLPCGIDESKGIPQVLWLGERLVEWAGLPFEKRSERYTPLRRRL